MGNNYATVFRGFRSSTVESQSIKKTSTSSVSSKSSNSFNIFNIFGYISGTDKYPDRTAYLPQANWKDSSQERLRHLQLY